MKKGKKKRVHPDDQLHTATQWFVEPRDKFTNDAIAAFLTEKNVICPDDDGAKSSMPDEDGNLHQVWEMKYRHVAELVENRRTLPLRFRIFNKNERARNIREYVFLYPEVRQQLARKKLSAGQKKALKSRQPHG